MKLALYNDFKPGLLKGNQVVDIGPGVVSVVGGGSPQEVMQKIITNYKALKPEFDRLMTAGVALPLSDVRLRAPLPRPRKIICCVGNYKEGTQREPRPQDYFLKSPEAVIGPGDTVELPDYPASIFHHEAELGVVIGAPASKVKARDAMKHVFGYTCFTDVSARNVPQRPPGAAPGAASFLGKSYDTFAPIGPCIATADEIPDPHRLSVKFWVQGQLRQDYNTDDMEHLIPQTIEFASSVMTLLPGDIIACGTNHQGLGPLQDGDLGEIEIQGIGKMSMKVVDPLKRTWPRGVDHEMAARVRGAR